MKTYNFKNMIEMALDDSKREEEQIYDIQQIMDVMEVDGLLVHELLWEGPKPGKDIELLGEHWFFSHWDETEKDPMEDFRAVLPNKKPYPKNKPRKNIAYLVSIVTDLWSDVVVGEYDGENWYSRFNGDIIPDVTAFFEYEVPEPHYP